MRLEANHTETTLKCRIATTTKKGGDSKRLIFIHFVGIFSDFFARTVSKIHARTHTHGTPSLPPSHRHRNRPARQRARAEQLLPIGTVVTVDVSQDSNGKSLGRCQGTLVQHSHGWYTVKLPSGQLIKRRRFRLKTDKETSCDPLSSTDGVHPLLSSTPTPTSPHHLHGASAGVDESDLHGDPLDLEMNDSPDPYEDIIARSPPPLVHAPSPADVRENDKEPANRRKRRRRNRLSEIPVGTAVVVDDADAKNKGVITGKCLGWYTVQLAGGREMKIRRSKLSVDEGATHDASTIDPSDSPVGLDFGVMPADDVSGESLSTRMLLDTPLPEAVTMDGDEEADHAGDIAEEGTIGGEDLDIDDDAIGEEEDEESEPEMRPDAGVDSETDDASVDDVEPVPLSPSVPSPRATPPPTTTAPQPVASPPELKQQQALASLPSQTTVSAQVLSPLTVPRQPSTVADGNDAASDVKVRHPLEVPLSGQQIVPPRAKAVHTPRLSPHSKTLENALKKQTMWRAQPSNQQSKQPPTHPLISQQPTPRVQSPSPRTEALSVPEQPGQTSPSPQVPPSPEKEEQQINPEPQQPLQPQIQLQPEPQVQQQEKPQPEPQSQVQQVQAQTLPKPQTQPQMQPLPQETSIAIVAVAVSEAELEDDGTSVQLLPVASSLAASALEGDLEGVPISNAVLESDHHSPAPLLDASFVTTSKAAEPIWNGLAVVQDTTPSGEAKPTRPVAIAAAPAAPAPSPAGVSTPAVIAEVVPSPAAEPEVLPTTTVAAVPAATARVHDTNAMKHRGKQARQGNHGDVVGDGSTGCAADALVAALPEKIKEWYGEIVWTKQRGFPWWPGYVYDPRQLDPESEIFTLAMDSIQTHFSIYFMNADKYEVVEHGSVRAWDEFMNTMYEETAAALPDSRREQLESAVARATVELHKPKEGRLWCQHYLYTKNAEESARLRERQPHWTVVSATESCIQLRLLDPSAQTCEQIVEEELDVTTAPADNSGGDLVPKDDPFIAHATREIDTAEPANKKAKKGVKLQKKSKRKQSKEEKSVRPASEPLDAKDNFGLYMFGLSHPGWQTLMCGFSLVSKCEGFEGYIREQKRYKQRSVGFV